jgi:MFS transporter, SP family, sugar:H+ symporter
MTAIVLIGLLSPIAADGIAYKHGYVFAGCNILAALLVWFFLYESRTLSLENVDLMYGDPSIKAYNSSKWVPPSYITQKQRGKETFRRRSVAATSGHHAVAEKEENRHSGTNSNDGTTLNDRV